MANLCSIVVPLAAIYCANWDEKKIPLFAGEELQMQNTLDIPRIDPNVRHVGVSKLRKLNSNDLKNSEDTLVLQENDTPLAVLLKYENYLILQNQLDSLMATIEVLTSELGDLKSGIDDLNAGRTKSISEVMASLKKKR
jgi:hypothetical protein